MYVTRISCYITLYIAFGIILGRSWNVLPVDTGVRLYLDELFRGALSTFNIILTSEERHVLVDIGLQYLCYG
jgi:hypothetical protein